MCVIIVALLIAQAVPARVRAIEFAGNRAFSSETLQVALEHISVGADWHPGAFEADVELGLKRLLKRHGFLNPDVRWEVLPEGHDVRVRVQVEEGPQYRLSRLAIVGAREFTAEDLLRQFELNPGDIVDMSRIKTGLDRIKRMYEERGYIGYSFLPTQSTDDTSRTMDLSVEVLEASRYRVVQVAFAGAKDQAQEDRARAVVALREGDVFRWSGVELSLESLSVLPDLKEVGEQHVSVEILDERQGLVRVLFKLRPRE